MMWSLKPSRTSAPSSEEPRHEPEAKTHRCLYPASQAWESRVHGSRFTGAIPWREGAPIWWPQLCSLRRRKVSLGSAVFITTGQARRTSLALLTGGIRDKTTAPLFRDFAAGPWRDSWVHHCKPSTIRWRDWNLENRLLPEFGHLRLDRITSTTVMRWFDDYSGTAPGNANHCLQILRHVFNHAVACEHVASNPARSIKPNARKKTTRFLSREELDQLHRILDARSNATKVRSSQRHQIDIIRLLLLTGCRKNEIVRLRRDEVVGYQLRLRDSKTGPRTVFLNAVVSRIVPIEAQAIFPH